MSDKRQIKIAKMKRSRYLLLIILLAAGLTSAAQDSRVYDVPYVATEQAVVDAMLKLANVTSKDVVFDLGCGDGRIVITAAKEFGATGTGIDIDPERIKEANANARAAKVTDKVKFTEADLFKTDFSSASVVTLYLLPSINLKLRPRLLAQLKPGSRIVSHNFNMGDWQPDKVIGVNKSTIYLWIVPEKK